MRAVQGNLIILLKNNWEGMERNRLIGRRVVRLHDLLLNVG